MSLTLKVHKFNPVIKREPFYCDGCSKTYPNLIVLKNELWKEVSKGNPGIMLCLSCIEERLGRLLEFSDLKDCGVTNSIMLGIVLYERSGKPPLDVDPNFIKDY
jgi:hypothetical protein